MQFVQIELTKHAAPGIECTSSKCTDLPHPKSSCLPWIACCSSLKMNQYIKTIMKLQTIVMVYSK